MMILAWLSFAWGQRLVATESLGGAITDVLLSSDEQHVAFVSANNVYLYSTLTWSSQSYSPCGTESIQGGAFSSSDTLYVGCGDGTISTLEMDGSSQDNVLITDSKAIIGLQISGSTLYAVAENPAGGNPLMHSFELSNGSEDTTNFPIILLSSGYKDMEVVGGNLILSHGSSNVSRIELNSGFTSRQLGTLAGVSLSDVLPDANGINPLLAGGEAGVVRFLLLSGWMEYAFWNEDINSITALLQDGDSIWLADESMLRNYSYNSASTEIGSEVLNELDLGLSETISEMITTNDYLIFAGSSGTYGVVTDRPWVEIDSLSSTVAVQNDIIDLTFMADGSGRYEIRVGGTSNTNGVLLSSGEVTENVSQTVSLTVDDNFAEGANLIRVVVNDGLYGHDSIVLTVDNPPQGVALDESNVAVGNKKLSLTFDPLSDEDIASYTVYVSEEEFVNSDYSTGGPEFSGISAENRVIPHKKDTSPRITLYPLLNDTRYYIAVRAFDEGGLEGPMSNVISAIPKETYSASSLAGETGGYCATTPQRLGYLGLLSMLLVAIRRKPVLLALLLCFVSMPADAAKKFSSKKAKKDIFGAKDRKWNGGKFEFRFGPLNFDSQSINAVFDEDGHRAIHVDAGLSMWRVIDIYGGAGFIQQMGWLLTQDGAVSNDHDMLTIYPLSINGAIRLDVFKNQWIVPYAAAGYDYWVWRENWMDGETEKDVSGGKTGSHYAFGGQILLDSFDEGAASRLLLRFGIQDTYFTGEYRVQTIGEDQSGLIFSGNSTTFGIRFQY